MSPEEEKIIDELLHKECFNISYSTDLSLNQLIARNKVIEKKAFTLDDLLRRTTRRSIKYSVGCLAKVRKSDPNIGRWLFNVRCGGRRSKGPYDVRFRLKSGKIFDELNKNDIQVSCNCNAWKYNGPDYNAITKGYSERQYSNGNQPNTRDRFRKYLICKHIAACVPIFMRFLFQRRRDEERYGLRPKPEVVTPVKPVVKPVVKEKPAPIKEQEKQVPINIKQIPQNKDKINKPQQLPTMVTKNMPDKIMPDKITPFRYAPQPVKPGKERLIPSQRPITTPTMVPSRKPTRPIRPVRHLN